MTRAEVARYVVTKVRGERSQVIDQAAAWLIDTKRVRESGYLANDIAQLLTCEGYLYVKVTTARKLSAQTTANITAYLTTATGASIVELEPTVEPLLIGGATIETPDASLDTTVRHQLIQLAEGGVR